MKLPFGEQSQPLHPSSGDLKPSPRQRRRRHGGVPLEGLPRQGRRSSEGHGPGHVGVHPTFPDACPTRRVPSHPALRPTGQRRPQIKPRQMPCVALRSPRNRRVHRKWSQRSPRSRCVNHAPVAAGSCASSRSSAVGKNRCRARRHGSRPHDIQTVCQSSQPNPGWLHQAEPARTRCADRSRAWLANTIPPKQGRCSRTKGSGFSYVQRCEKRQTTRRDRRGIERQRTFPIGITRTPAPSSSGGFPTRVLRAPARNVASGPASDYP